MANKYLKHSAGNIVEQEATGTSAGAGDAGKIVALNATGKVDETMMPPGVAADVALLTASENLAAGDLVNVYSNVGVASCRKADASNGRTADGFVIANVLSDQPASVYFEGLNDQKSALTIGANQYLSGTTPGGVTETPPSTAGYIVQKVGKAHSATAFSFEPQQPITLA